MTTDTDLKTRVIRLEHALTLLLRRDGARAVALAEIAAVTGGAGFLAAEVWDATHENEDLARALQRVGIQNPHGLARWLADCEGFGVIRAGSDKGRTLWVVSDPPETT